MELASTPREKARNLTILAGSTLTVMAGATISPTLPAMEQAFANEPHIGFLVRLALTIPALFIILSGPLCGYLLDRVGRKPVLIAAVVLYAVAGSSGLVVDNIYAVIAGRACLGLAMGATTAGFNTIIGDLFSGTALNRFMGLQGSLIHFGAVVFQISGGFLAELGWRAPFSIYLLALPVLPGLIWALTETKPDQRPASVESAGRPVADDQGMPWGRLSVSYVTAFLGMTLFYLIPVQIPFHLQHLLGLSGVHIGIAMGAMSASAACAAPFYGRLRTKWSFQSVFAALFGAMALGYFGLFLVRDFWLVLLSLAVFGVGMGVMLPNLNVWVASVAPAQYRGRAMSGLAASYYFGQFVCPMLSQPVADQVGLPNTYGLGAILLTIISLSFLFQNLRLSKAGE